MALELIKNTSATVLYMDFSNIKRKDDERFDWKNSIGCTIDFNYNSIEGTLKIINCKNKNLIVEYNNNAFSICSRELKNGKIGKIIGVRTSEFKYNIGESIVTDKRNGIIINKRKSKGRRKEYKYHCNNCNGENWVTEYNIKNRGCPYCSNHKVLKGYNDIATTDPWMIDLGMSKEDAETHTRGSNDKVTVTCPHCGNKKEITIDNIRSHKSICCPICSIGASYPEKFVNEFLKQINTNNVIREYNPKWSDNRRYDFKFSFNDMEYIIECHGKQHYIDNSFSRMLEARNLEEEQKNDKYKKELLNKNEPNTIYIELDCRESTLEHIKNSILNSELNDLIKNIDIDWLKCESISRSINIKEQVWNLYNKYHDLNKVADITGYTRRTITTWCKQGFDIGKCDYNIKQIKKDIDADGIVIKVYDKSMNLIHTFDSILQTSKELNIPYSTLQYYLTNNRPHKKYIFEKVKRKGD